MIAIGCDVGSLTAKAFIMNEKGWLAGMIMKNIINGSETKDTFYQYH
jgi:activator of 2-hydroxyglutaryl-CoA dehydratase